MQGIGYIEVKGEAIKVLWRATRTYRAIKIRMTGQYGVYLKDESLFLEDKPDLVKKLKNSEVVYL